MGRAMCKNGSDRPLAVAPLGEVFPDLPKVKDEKWLQALAKSGRPESNVNALDLRVCAVFPVVR